MAVSTLLVLAAVAASLLAVLTAAQRIVPIIALVASGLEAVLRLGLISLHVTHVPIGLALAAALAVAGAILWMRAITKPLSTAATVILLVGAVQLVSALAPGRLA